jgi:hypothetical protein
VTRNVCAQDFKDTFQPRFFNSIRWQNLPSYPLISPLIFSTFAQYPDNESDYSDLCSEPISAAWRGKSTYTICIGVGASDVFRHDDEL